MRIGLTVGGAFFLCGSALAQSTPTDTVHGNLIQFTDNGAWSWYQDERAIVDVSMGALWVGSIANQSGLGGGAVDGHVRATRFDLNTGIRTATVLGDIESYGAGDDHNVPAFLLKEDGDILAFYAGHNNVNGAENYNSFYRTYDTSAQNWSSQSQYNWAGVIPADAPGAGGTTYSNVFQLSGEDADGDGNGRIYNIARTQQSPHMMYSDDNGATWLYGGQLTQQNATPPSSSYVNGYYKYSSNGTDRIDIVATEYHPRDYNTSIYHAYIQGGTLYNSSGDAIDSDIFDSASSFNSGSVASTDSFTEVFQAGSAENSRAWNTDVQSYSDGSISVLFKARDGRFGSHSSGADNHNVWIARFDPIAQVWTSHEVARAGGQLFGGNETDYTGLGAFDPNDPNVLYISTEINPLTSSQTAHHEIYKGVTPDYGATWSWTAITENSSYDNLRPIVPKWDEDNLALLWWRGTMSSSQNYDTAVTGIVIQGNELRGKVRYVDASTSNTTRADGQPFNPTTSSSQGPADNSWHLRTGFGNDSTVFTAAELDVESVPVLITTISNVDAGTYDLFAFFWSDFDSSGSAGDWRIVAGLSEGDMMVYRPRGAQQAEAEHFDLAVLTDEGNRSLYRAYLGRVVIDDGELLEVFVEAHNTSGNGRVWYDGIGYAPVVTSVPEPTSVALLLLGVACLCGRRAFLKFRSTQTLTTQRSLTTA